MIELLNIDCMEYMATLKNNAFDLVIADPPYGIGADNKNSVKKLQSKKSASLSKDYGRQVWDNNIPTLDYFNEVKRVSKNQIIWGVNHYPYKILTGGRIYWDKCVTMPTYSDGELAYCSFINSIKSYKFAWHGMIQGDMKNKEQRIHPTQKPIQLYKWILINYAKEGYKILDTHGGSFSIACAVHDINETMKMDLDLVVCEIDKDYYDSAVKRYNNHKAQTKLF